MKIGLENLSYRKAAFDLFEMALVKYFLKQKSIMLLNFENLPLITSPIF